MGVNDNEGTTMNIVGRRVMKYSARFCAAILAALLSLPSSAELVQGRDYDLLSPTQPVDSGKKIEVKEFFSYACHSCNELRPFFVQWESKCPNDVAVVRVPLSLGHPQWEPLVRTYYALDASGDAERLDPLLFHAIHESHENLFSDAAIVSWLARQNVDGKKIASLMSSFSVNVKSKEAERQSRSYKVNQTPTVIVNGKYRLLANAAKSYAEWPALIDQLVAKARAESR